MGLGKFIVLEGPDGSGKSTQAALLVGALHGPSLPEFPGPATGDQSRVHHLRDPGGTSVGESIRAILLNNESLVNQTELFLFLASRCQLVAEKIRPALRAGHVVVCERFVASTFCYQVFPYSQAADPEYLRNMFTIVRNSALDLVPDLTLLLDVAPEVGLDRKSNPVIPGMDERKLDRIERRGEFFQGQVRAGYGWLANAGLIPNLVVIPPGSVASTHQAVLGHVRRAVLAR